MPLVGSWVHLIDAEDGEGFIADIPKPGGVPVFAPVSFIGMNHRAQAHFIEKIRMNGVGVASGPFFETQGAGRDKIDPKECLHRGVDFSVGQSQDVAQIERGGFGLWPNGSKGQFAFEGLDDRAAASRAKGGVVNVAGRHGARHHDKVLLHIGGLPADARVRRALAMRAEQRGFDVDPLVNGSRNHSVPSRMAPGCSTRLARQGDGVF